MSTQAACERHFLGSDSSCVDRRRPYASVAEPALDGFREALYRDVACRRFSELRTNGTALDPPGERTNVVATANRI